MAMQPVVRQPGMARNSRPSGLADVIELILDKGLVIDAFVRVAVVGIELITIDARIVVASVDTYLRFAEAVNRLDLTQVGGGASLQDLTDGSSRRSKGRRGQGLERAGQRAAELGSRSAQSVSSGLERGRYEDEEESEPASRPRDEVDQEASRPEPAGDSGRQEASSDDAPGEGEVAEAGEEQPAESHDGPDDQGRQQHAKGQARPRSAAERLRDRGRVY